jgi:hypothetical protein
MQYEAANGATRDCLVAVVNNDLDLKRFSEEHWYRIPKRAVGRTVGAGALAEANVLALYQTASIGAGLPGAIELWGEVAERLVTPRRVLLPDEPDHPAADEEYHVIRLTNVERLPMPIVSRRPRRITFLRTTRTHLFHAADINELIVGTAAEERLWRAMRDHDELGEGEIERRYYMRMGGVVMEMDFALFREERGFGIQCREADHLANNYGDVPHAWGMLRFSPARLDAEFAKCVEEIASEVRRMREEI